MQGSGALFLLSLAVLLGASAWLEQSHLFPIAGPDSVAYYFGAAPRATLVWSVLSAVAILAAVHILVVRLLVRWSRSSVLPAMSDVRYLTPLALAAVHLLGLGVLNEPLRDLWAPIAYIAIDLRWFVRVLAVVLALAALRAQYLASLPREVSQARSASAARSLLTEGAVVAAVMAFVLVTSPQARFSPYTSGDEPKYLRFVENWWQGNGLQIDNFQYVQRLPRDEPSRLLHNLRHVWPAVRENLASLAADAALLANPANWTRRFNRAEDADHHVIRGKNGWHYQIHPPGISVLMLPAYVIDRTFFDRRTSLFADDLFTVHLLMLIVFAGVTIVSFRMTVAAGARPAVAALAVCGVMMSLPMAAFPFTFYPETTAGLIVAGVTWRLFAREPLSRRSAAIVGLAVGYLGWLHVRFLVVAALSIGWLLLNCRPAPRVAATLLGAFAFVIATLCAYAYHLTGSLLPSAPFALGVGSGFVTDRVPLGVVAMFIDRMFGLLPLAPVFILALPGAGLMAARRPRDLAMIASLALALIIPSAGQGYWTDGSVPWRHALAILPLASVPLALWIEDRRSHPLAMGGALLLAAMSVRTAAAYNYQNDKTISTMVDAGFAGWDLSVLFPVMSRVRTGPVSVDAWQMLFVLATIVVVFAYGALAGGRATADVELPRPGAVARGFAVALVAVAAIACSAIALGGPAHRWELMRGHRPPFPDPLASYWFEVGRRPPPRWE